MSPRQTRREAICPCCAGKGRGIVPDGMVWPLDAIDESFSDEPLIIFTGVDLDFIGEENGLKYKLTINLHMRNDSCQTIPTGLSQMTPRFPKRKLLSVGSAREQGSTDMLSASSATVQEGSLSKIDEAIDQLDFGDKDKS